MLNQGLPHERKPYPEEEDMVDRWNRYNRPATGLPESSAPVALTFALLYTTLVIVGIVLAIVL